MCTSIALSALMQSTAPTCVILGVHVPVCLVDACYSQRNRLVPTLGLSTHLGCLPQLVDLTHGILDEGEPLENLGALLLIRVGCKRPLYARLL